MYIISKTKDYYDGVVGTMGIDKTIVYNREPKIIENEKEFPKEFQSEKGYSFLRKNKTSFTSLSHHNNIKDSGYEKNSPFIIGFCGKLYIGWKLYHENKDKEVTVKIIYGKEQIEKYIKQETYSSNINDNIDYINSYNSVNIFIKLNTPIFIYDTDYERKSIRIYNRKPVLLINPKLNDYDFFKIIDSFTAFQEIQMFLGGVLVSEKNVPLEVEDKYKITQHGFDKWSFRREPTNKK